MNANDMNFRQKDLKTIFNKKPDKDIRRNIFESASHLYNLRLQPSA